MIARLARFKPMTAEVEAAMLDNLRIRFRDALDAQPGFVGGSWAKAENGSWISFNFWENQRRWSAALLRRGRPRSSRVSAAR